MFRAQLVAHCTSGSSACSGRTGDHEQFREHLTTATMLFGYMDMCSWREEAETEMSALAP
jgi:hypothetical protein